MKKWFVLLLTMLLLTGCGNQGGEETTAPVETVPVTEPGLYTPDSSWEKDSQGALRSYQMENAMDAGLLEIADGYVLIAVSGTEEKPVTTATILRGEDLHPAATMELEGAYPVDVWQVHKGGKQLACRQETGDYLLFDAALNQTGSIQLPDEHTGTALLSSDFGTVYYSTSTEIRALDAEQGFSRPLRKGSEGDWMLCDLAFGDSMLRYTRQVENAIEFCAISTATGEDMSFAFLADTICVTGDDAYFVYCDHMVDEYVFGTLNGKAQQLQLSQPVKELSALPEAERVLTVQLQEQQLVLSRYDLKSGLRTGEVTLPESLADARVSQSEDGQYVWIADGQSSTLLRWEPAKSPTEDTTQYVTPHYTAEAPDTEGLQACKDRAKALETALGIQILLGDEVADLAIVNYTFAAGYHPAVFQEMLDALEAAAAKLPEGFLKQVSDCNPSKPLCVILAYEIIGESGPAKSLQYWGSDSTSIVLTPTEDLQQAFLRELYSAIDVAILNTLTTFDFWEDHNPSGAEYVEELQESSSWLEGEDPAFLDAEAMLSPREDRASLFVWSLEEENRFEGAILQSKLNTFCKAMRKLFELPETVLWEQHLVVEE